MPETRNSKVLIDFVQYCIEHPNERFWQALRNWSGYHFITAVGYMIEDTLDTFYWEGKRHDDPKTQRS